MEASPTEIAAFKAALNRHITTTSEKEAAAAVLGVGVPAINTYLAGSREPSRSSVFALEEHLGLTPGSLSRLLGYLPTTARSASSVLDALRSDGKLSVHDRETLALLYRNFTEGT